MQRQIQFDGKTEQERKPTEWKRCPACWGCLPSSGQCLKRAGYDGLFRKLFLPAQGAWVWRISSSSDTVSKKICSACFCFPILRDHWIEQTGLLVASPRDDFCEGCIDNSSQPCHSCRRRSCSWLGNWFWMPPASTCPIKAMVCFTCR